VSYPWTRVPSSDPPVDRVQEKLVPLADLVMGIFWSRPGGLSLRTTWVTPATLVLASSVSAISFLAALTASILAVARGSLLLVLAAAGCGLLAMGTGVVALYGIRQRLLR
jgi:hypothetical protein